MPLRPKTSAAPNPLAADLQDFIREQEQFRQAAALAMPLTESLRSRATDPIFRTLTEEAERSRQLLATAASSITDRLHETSFLRLTAETRRQQELVRAALGPYEDMKRLAASHSSFSDAMGEAAALMGPAYLDHLHRPAFTEIEPLLSQARASALALSNFPHYDDAIRRAVEAMHTPWLDIQNRLRSLNGFTGLQTIGLELHQYAAFDAGLTKRLRTGLGDWRAPIIFPLTLIDDIADRTALYVEHGLNTNLTAFPAEAFRESLTIAGLDEAAPPIAREYVGDAEETEDEAGFARTNAAHARLLRFETQLRRFIDREMQAAFGPQWIKHRVPGDMHEQWEERKKRANLEGGRDRALITYADFTDYLKIIERKDNWRDLFRAIFRNTDSVRESFQRLYPIRLCVMHARFITQDDELYLHVETMRLFGLHPVPKTPS